jgi:hypothetical protein
MLQSETINEGMTCPQMYREHVIDINSGSAKIAARLIEAKGRTDRYNRDAATLGAKTSDHEMKIVSIGREIEVAFAACQRDQAMELKAVMYDAIRNRAAESQAAREVEIWAAIEREPGGRFFVAASDLALAWMLAGKGGSSHG